MTNHFCDIEIFPVLFLNPFITIISGSYMKYVYVWKKSFCLLRVFIILDLLRVGYVLVNPYIGIHIHRYFSIVLAFPSFECTYTEKISGIDQMGPLNIQHIIILF